MFDDLIDGPSLRRIDFDHGKNRQPKSWRNGFQVFKKFIIYGARLDLVNFPRRFCVPVALRLWNRKKMYGRHFFAEQMSERIGEANLESFQDRDLECSAIAAPAVPAALAGAL